MPEHGWASKSNGELLRLASEEFDVFVTADQNLEYQQNVSKYEIGVLVLVAPSNRLEDLAPLIPVLLDSLAQITSGQLVRIGV